MKTKVKPTYSKKTYENHGKTNTFSINTFKSLSKTDTLCNKSWFYLSRTNEKSKTSKTHFFQYYPAVDSKANSIEQVGFGGFFGCVIGSTKVKPRVVAQSIGFT